MFARLEEAVLCGGQAEGVLRGAEGVLHGEETIFGACGTPGDDVIDDVVDDDVIAFRAAAEAILAWAAALGVSIVPPLWPAPKVVGERDFLKKRLPEGRSLVSSFRENPPSLVGTDGAAASVVGVAVGVASGGEWSLMKERPYRSL